MDKAVKKHLERRGRYDTSPRKDDIAFSERNSEFFKWFEESVMGFDSERYRREFRREARRSGYTVGHVPYGLAEYHRASQGRLRGSLTAYFVAMGVSFFIWAVRREVDRHVHRLRRPTYYERERARRQALSEERRRVRQRRTLNPCPGMDEIREALAHACESVESMLRLGSLMEDLECYVDNSIYFAEDGSLKGRRGGVRRHLEKEAPDLYARYKTLMRYKGLAKRFRQATGVSDPIPAVALLSIETEEGNPKRMSDEEIKKVSSEHSREFTSEQYRARKRAHVLGMGEGVADGGMGPSRESLRRARELISDCETSLVSLAAQLALRIDPNYAPHAPPDAQDFASKCDGFGMVAGSGERPCATMRGGRVRVA